MQTASEIHIVVGSSFSVLAQSIMPHAMHKERLGVNEWTDKDVLTTGPENEVRARRELVQTGETKVGPC